jgi:hypothetical protein
MQKVEELDQKEEEKRRPQPTAQPTPQPETSTTEAKITVIDQNHKGGIHTYWVRIADPLNFDEAYDFPLPLIVDFSEVPASDYGTASSSGTPTRTSAGSDAVSSEPKWTYVIDAGELGKRSRASEATSKPPQKKKPRFYFGKQKD